MLDPCWHHFSLLGASWAHFVLLVAFVVVFGWFLCVLGRSCSILESSERVWGGFWRPQGFIFRGFLPTHACNAKKARQAFCIGKTNTKRMSAIQRTTLKTNKIRPGRLSNNVFCQDCAKNLSWRSPSSVLEGSGSLGGSSWVHLAGFWVLLGGSWPLLGASWAPLGRLLGALGRMLSAKSVPGLDFGRFGRLPG